MRMEMYMGRWWGIDGATVIAVPDEIGPMTRAWKWLEQRGHRVSRAGNFLDLTVEHRRRCDAIMAAESGSDNDLSEGSNDGN